jgi:flagellar basal-body rod modification protein FlgD
MATSSNSGIGSEISMDSFLTLFVTQLKNQNPLDPTDNTEFMSQLAQFSTLEQEQQQTGYLASMNSIDTASLQLDQITMASSFIGKTIKYSSDETGATDKTLTGVVEGVKLEKDGTVSFIINDKSVPISYLIEVEDTSTANTSTRALTTTLSKSDAKK